MREITSVHNPIIKQVQSLHQKKNRNELGLFLIEGYKNVNEALKSGIKLENIFTSQKFSKELPFFEDDKIFRVSEQVLRKISTTESPPDIVATVRQMSYKPEDIFKADNPLIIVLESIKDPGNLGTIIRTAKAANVSGIILTDEAVDVYNPKTVRASAGNLWKMPIIYMPEKKEIKNILNKFCKCRFIATIVDKIKNPNLYYDVNYKNPTVLLFGSEGGGLSEDLLETADEFITIPMNEEVESLNLSISAGVILYESLRQRNFIHS